MLQWPLLFKTSLQSLLANAGGTLGRGGVGGDGAERSDWLRGWELWYSSVLKPKSITARGTVSQEAKGDLDVSFCFNWTVSQWQPGSISGGLHLSFLFLFSFSKEKSKFLFTLYSLPFSSICTSQRHRKNISVPYKRACSCFSCCHHPSGLACVVLSFKACGKG